MMSFTKRRKVLLVSIFLIISFSCSSSLNRKESCNTNGIATNISMENDALNIYGQPLGSCCTDPMTGFYRNGFCQTGRDDYGTHIACAVVTNEFLEYSKAQGNDLITPNSNYHFPGLKPGDKWCLCITRWLEAVKEGVAPPLDLQATHQNALQYCSKDLLELYSVSRSN